MKIFTENNSKLLLIFGFTLFVAGIAIFFYKQSVDFNAQVNSERIAQFGDFIGGAVGSLWSLAGVILFYVALTEQRTDIRTNQETLKTQVTALNKQIEEFELQRKELSETRKIFKEQSETLKIQRFENTFFQLLSLHHELVEKLNFEKPNYGGQILEKRAVLSAAFKDLENEIKFSNSVQTKKNGIPDYELKEPGSIEIAKERMKKAYRKFYFDDYKQILSHYFRNVYHIFKFIYTSKLIENKKKQFYTSLVRAQLSSDELCLILYNSLQLDLGYPNFLFLIKEFDLMQNFDFRIIEKNKYHKEIYDDKIKNVSPAF